MLTVAAGPCPLLRVWPVIRPRDRLVVPGSVHPGPRLPRYGRGNCRLRSVPPARMAARSVAPKRRGMHRRRPDRRGGDTSPYWARVLRGPGAHRYRAASDERAGAFILPADGSAGYGTRDKLVCIGRRHPRYERVVTAASAERAYRAAVADGKTSIRLSEI
jgi:hypothetical protein